MGTGWAKFVYKVRAKIFNLVKCNEISSLHIKAPFIWRKVVPGKRVTLLAESTLPSVYMRKKLTPLPEPRANFPITTELAHALIVSP